MRFLQEWLEITIYCDVTLCSLVYIYFRSACFQHNLCLLCRQQVLLKHHHISTTFWGHHILEHGFIFILNLIISVNILIRLLGSMTESGFNPGRGIYFSILYSIQAGYEVHPAFYPMCIKVFSQGSKSTRLRSMPLTSIQYQVRDPKEGWR